MKRGKYMVNMAHRNSTHLLTLINDLLDFSEIDAGNIKIKPKSINIRDEISNVTESLDHAAKEKGLELNAYVDPKIDTHIMLDPARLYQILANLVNNAIKYTPKGSVTIKVSLIDNDNQALIRFEVIDTGIGIPKDNHEKIFEKFYQVDASSTREFGGAGLGLTICSHLVSAMSGNIDMESSDGKGSRFWFDLPYVIADED